MRAGGLNPSEAQLAELDADIAARCAETGERAALAGLVPEELVRKVSTFALLTMSARLILPSQVLTKLVEAPFA